MENTHNTLSIDSHVNLGSRVTAAEASAFMRPFNHTIETESGDPFQIRYFRHRTQRSHRVTASASEMEQVLPETSHSSSLISFHGRLKKWRREKWS